MDDCHDRQLVHEERLLKQGAHLAMLVPFVIAGWLISAYGQHVNPALTERATSGVSDGSDISLEVGESASLADGQVEVTVVSVQSADLEAAPSDTGGAVLPVKVRACVTGLVAPGEVVDLGFKSWSARRSVEGARSVGDPDPPSVSRNVVRQRPHFPHRLVFAVSNPGRCVQGWLGLLLAADQHQPDSRSESDFVTIRLESGASAVRWRAPLGDL